jgi:hypothetical protein
MRRSLAALRSSRPDRRWPPASLWPDSFSIGQRDGLRAHGTGGRATLLASLGVHFSGVYFLGGSRRKGTQVARPTSLSRNSQMKRTDRDLRSKRSRTNITFAVVGGLIMGVGLALASLLFVTNYSLPSTSRQFFFVPLVLCNDFNNFARRIELATGARRAVQLS